jgi:uncharacterized protein YndB with AHSA1/START domain
MSTNNLQFDFTFDTEARTALIIREFAADLALVWDAYTIPEILDQWWAPRPWSSVTKYMHFEVGGQRFYAMVSPEGLERWAIHQYTSITPKTNFKFHNTFADKDGNPDQFGSDWDLTFSEQDGKTKVSISIYNDSRERMEQMIAMGFKEGFTMAQQNLDEVLAKLAGQR